MKRILLITTGGTIACRQTPAGLSPVMDASEILRFVPTVSELCEIQTLPLMNKDSTEIMPSDWLAIARNICERYERFDGFVVTHGTDTMAYTTAALSYLIQRSPKPVVVTGSQRPIDADINDARQNLLDSFRCACDARTHGVVLVFDGEVIAGTRAKKTHTKSYNAFSSVNYPALARIQDGRMVTYIERSCGDCAEFYDELCERVELVKLTPASSPRLLEEALCGNDAVVVESFGTGGVPARFRHVFENAAAQDKLIVMTTQVPNEGSDMTIYKVGREIKEKLSLLEAFDMTLEAVLAKLMWVLALGGVRDELRARFYAPIGEDILFSETESNTIGI
ncbi:MAG: asparaginase [Oscillospiraceae bacterium]